MPKTTPARFTQFQIVSYESSADGMRYTRPWALDDKGQLWEASFNPYDGWYWRPMPMPQYEVGEAA